MHIRSGLVAVSLALSTTLGCSGDEAVVSTSDTTPSTDITSTTPATDVTTSEPVTTTTSPAPSSTTTQPTTTTTSTTTTSTTHDRYVIAATHPLLGTGDRARRGCRWRVVVDG